MNRHLLLLAVAAAAGCGRSDPTVPPATSTPAGSTASPPQAGTDGGLPVTAPVTGSAADGGVATPAAAEPPGSPQTPAAAPSAPGWVTVASEDFERLAVPQPPWQRDPVPDDGPFADGGEYFARQGIVPPEAWRISQALGTGWLTAESYTRSPAATPFGRLVSVTTDPADPGNHVLRIASPAHTDATVIRSTDPLPARYRISLRVGFPSFGDGLPGLNGYATGQEKAEPWWPDDATTQNGFYSLAILDAPPRPHNNTWIHHHRKVVMDSDNHYPAWMEVFDGHSFVWSGEHPMTMLAIDGRGPDSARTGKPFLAYAGGAWQHDLVRAVDAYLPGRWYGVSIERFDRRFTLEISGEFRYGGRTTYRASIDGAESCVWHFNRTADEDASGCQTDAPLDGLDGRFPQWPAGATWPDYAMFGDPHVNYYMGEVYYDDVRLEAWRP